MSLYTMFDNGNVRVYTGTDPIVGTFYQIFEKEMESETTNGEGMVYEWNSLNGTTINLTGMPSTGKTPQEFVSTYIKTIPLDKDN